MAHLSPDGPVYQAGTLSGNPLAMAAGLATLGIIAADATLYDRLEDLTRRLTDGLDEAMSSHGVPHTSATPSVRCSRCSLRANRSPICRALAARIERRSTSVSSTPCSTAESTSRPRSSRRASSRRRTPRTTIERTVAAADDVAVADLPLAGSLWLDADRLHRALPSTPRRSRSASAMRSRRRGWAKRWSRCAITRPCKRR